MHESEVSLDHSKCNKVNLSVKAASRLSSEAYVCFLLCKTIIFCKKKSEEVVV